MLSKLAQPFSNAFLSVMPQLGLNEVKLQNSEVCNNKIKTPGVVVIIGFVGDLQGSVIFAMSEANAKKIASTMMGMDVVDFDEMAQSAVSELSNMLAANACTGLSEQGVSADISTPTLVHGNFTAVASFDHVTRMEMLANGMTFYIYVSVENK